MVRLQHPTAVAARRFTAPRACVYEMLESPMDDRITVASVHHHGHHNADNLRHRATRTRSVYDTRYGTTNGIASAIFQTSQTPRIPSAITKKMRRPGTAARRRHRTVRTLGVHFGRGATIPPRAM